MKIFRFPLALLGAAVGALLPAARAAEDVWLSAVVNPYEAECEGARPGLDRNAQKQPLKIAGREFARGVGVQVNTSIAVAPGGAQRFTACVGVDDAFAGPGAVAFEVQADGQSLWRRVLAAGQPAEAVALDVRGRQLLVLVAEDVGNAATQAGADWADAKFSVEGEKPKSAPVPPVPEAPYLLTPPAPATPRINGARVFGVRPGHPFLFQIPATGERPMRFAADGLPAGLALDAATGRITGALAQPGTHVVTLRATNARGTDEKPLRIEAGERLALTPPMGWNSWNCWGGDVDQDKVLRSARAMVASGLVHHGWTYVNIDDAWQGTRPPPAHALQSNEKFPDMKKLCDEIHALGLKAGIYSTPWVTSYAKYPGGSAENPEGTWTKYVGTKNDYSGKVMPFAIGRYSFAAVDAKQWAEWGFDYLKYDWGPNEIPETDEMAKALRASGRDLVFSLSNTAPFRNAAGLARLAQAWRTTGDIRDLWGSVTALGFAQEQWRAFAGPGHWNDPDMLVVGRVGGPWSKTMGPTRLTPSEQYTHLTLWSLLAAPLLIGCPLELADDFTLNLLTNDEVLAVNQDELGRQAAPTIVDGRRQVWVKELADGSRAIGLFNLASQPQEVSVAWTQLGRPGPQRVRDLWRQQDRGVAAERFVATVPRHGAVLLRVWPAAK